MAARKGILVCNSAGNEGADSRWKTIITPADADSVLCIGGIDASLTDYARISFSSFGPTADGRLKPNVAAYGHAKTASVSDDMATHFVDGTSFSCPLVAGFAACALQCMPHLSAMQLFAAIEQSADRYPYYDYSLGYGVPQADVFVGLQQSKPQIFALAEDDDNVYAYFLQPVVNKALFYHYARPDGELDNYGEIMIKGLEENELISFSKAAISGHTLRLCMNGQVETYTLSEADAVRLATDRIFDYTPKIPKGLGFEEKRNGQLSNRVSQWGDNSRWSYDIFYQYAAVLGVASDVENLDYSHLSRYGVRVLRRVTKAYRVGIGIERSVSHLNFTPSTVNQLDAALWPPVTIDDLIGLKKKTLRLGEWSVEVFQRVRMLPGGALSGRGLYFDIGAYGGICSNRYKMVRQRNEHSDIMLEEHNEYRGLSILDNQRLNWGVSARFGYGLAALQVRYRLTGMLDGSVPTIDLPRLEVGMQVAF